MNRAEGSVRVGKTYIFIFKGLNGFRIESQQGGTEESVRPLNACTILEQVFRELDESNKEAAVIKIETRWLWTPKPALRLLVDQPG